MLVPLVLSAVVSAAVAAPAPHDIRRYGAVPDGKTLCTAAVQRAIDAAAAEGGTVLIGPGRWLCGTLRLKSRLTLELAKEAVLLGSPNLADYPDTVPAVRSYTDNYVRKSLLYGEGLCQVAIRGQGCIDGNGGAFKRKEYLTRPYVIRLVRSTDVTIEGIELRNSPMWMQHYLACDRLRFRGLRVHNHVSYNNDGMDLDGCHDVVVADCHIDSDDDALCLKSTLGRPCKNIAVSNCRLSSHCNAFKTGTESNGGFERISVRNCVIASPASTTPFYGSQAGHGGISLECVDGGTLQDVAVENVTISGVRVPIFVRLGNRARPFEVGGPKPPVGVLRGVSLRNIAATGADTIGCSITGLPAHPVEDIRLENVSIQTIGGGTRAQAARDIAERPEAYPEGTMFGVLPAYGFYCRHARGLKFANVTLQYGGHEERPALVADDVDGLAIERLTAMPPQSELALLRWINVRGGALCDISGGPGTRLLLRREGAESGPVNFQPEPAPGSVDNAAGAR